MKIVVLSQPSGWHYQDLLRASRKIDGLRLEAAQFSELRGRLGSSASGVTIGESGLDGGDCVLARAMPAGTLQQVVFRMDALQELARLGVTVINSPKTIEASVDKYLSLALMRREGVSIPTTLVCESESAAVEFLEEHEEVVVKPIFGSEGRGLGRFTLGGGKAEFLRAIRGPENGSLGGDSLGNVIYVQEFLPHEFDVRVLVVGDELFGMKRANASSWISNAAQGAKCSSLSIDDEVARLARLATAAVGGRLVGVDLVPCQDGQWRVLEVNAAPGWKFITDVVGVDIADRILRMLIDESKSG